MRRTIGYVLPFVDPTPGSSIARLSTAHCIPHNTPYGTSYGLYQYWTSIAPMRGQHWTCGSERVGH
eukprot:2410918-Rhodomonas_salina.5